MEPVLRRCLDCDCTFTVTSQCPSCASANTLIISTEAEPTVDEPKLGAMMLLSHALLVTLATHQTPGMVLGSFLFANALCSVLLLLGIDSMPRFVRISAALSVVIQVAIFAITGQALLFVPAMILTLAGMLLLYQDSTAGWLRPTLAIGVASGLLLGVLTIVAHYGVTLPGWWQGKYLFKDREIPIPRGLDIPPDQTLPTSTW